MAKHKIALSTGSTRETIDRLLQSGAAGRMGSGNCARDSVDEFGCGLDDGRKEKPISNDAGSDGTTSLAIGTDRSRTGSGSEKMTKSEKRGLKGSMGVRQYLVTVVSAASKNGGLSCDVERRSCRPS